MRRVCLAIAIVTGFLVVLGINPFFRVEPVDHHGYKIDVNGSRTDCLSCHEYTNSQIIPGCVPVCRFGKSHLSNKNYPPSHRGNFKPVSMVEQGGIKFVNGKIDCISCHNLQVNNSYHMRIKVETLCHACHDK